MFPLVALIFYLRARQYRGTWDAAGGNTADLLRLTARRAHAGIRLAWANMSAIVLVSVVSLAFAAPCLAPARWQHDPNPRAVLAPLIVVNGCIAAAALLLNVWCMRRQRARLRKIVQLLDEVTEPDTEHP